MICKTANGGLCPTQQKKPQQPNVYGKCQVTSGHEAVCYRRDIYSASQASYVYRDNVLLFVDR